MQVAHGVQAFAFVVVLNELEPQGKHARSVVAEPFALTYEPEEHVAQLEHDAAFADVEKDPLGHAEHERSAVAEPGLRTACPAAHEVHAAHAVPAEPS